MKYLLPCLAIVLLLLVTVGCITTTQSIMADFMDPNGKPSDLLVVDHFGRLFFMPAEAISCAFQNIKSENAESSQKTKEPDMLKQAERPKLVEKTNAVESVKWPGNGDKSNQVIQVSKIKRTAQFNASEKVEPSENNKQTRQAASTTPTKQTPPRKEMIEKHEEKTKVPVVQCKSRPVISETDWDPDQPIVK